jgi:hypothetical protein
MEKNSEKTEMEVCKFYSAGIKSFKFESGCFSLEILKFKLRSSPIGIYEKDQSAYVLPLYGRLATGLPQTFTRLREIRERSRP